MKIRCPECNYAPNGDLDWNCQACGSAFDMFEKAGECSNCGYEHYKTICPEFKGGCGAISNHLDWYGGMDAKLRELGIVKN